MLKVDEDHLEFGAIHVFLVHFSPKMASHARKNIIYPNDMSEIQYHRIVKDMICCRLPSSPKKRLLILGHVKIAFDESWFAILSGVFLPSTYKRLDAIQRSIVSKT